MFYVLPKNPREVVEKWAKHWQRLYNLLSMRENRKIICKIHLEFFCKIIVSRRSHEIYWKSKQQKSLFSHVQIMPTADIQCLIKKRCFAIFSNALLLFSQCFQHFFLCCSFNRGREKSNAIFLLLMLHTFMFLSRSLRSDVFFEFCHNFPEFVRSGRISFEVFFFCLRLLFSFLIVNKNLLPCWIKWKDPWMESFLLRECFYKKKNWIIREEQETKRINYTWAEEIDKSCFNILCSAWWEEDSWLDSKIISRRRYKLVSFITFRCLFCFFRGKGRNVHLKLENNERKKIFFDKLLNGKRQKIVLSRAAEESSRLECLSEVNSRSIASSHGIIKQLFDLR